MLILSCIHFTAASLNAASRATSHGGVQVCRGKGCTMSGLDAMGLIQVPFGPPGYVALVSASLLYAPSRTVPSPIATGMNVCETS